jgi:hypothetical protein
MKLRKCDSLLAAERVIAELQNGEQIDNICDKSIMSSIECYQNGREHGFILWAFFAVNSKGELMAFFKNKAYYICQHRRSDEIAIYKGEYAMQSISEDAYSNQKFFAFNEFFEAAKWIAEDIQKEYLSELNKNN